MANMDLYYLPASPPCRNVLLVAKLIGLDMNLKFTDVRIGQNKTNEFLKMNPEHVLPTLSDNGLIIWESRAIMTYLIETYGKSPEIQALYPKDPRKRVIVDQRLYFDVCTLYKNLYDYFGPVMKRMNPKPDNAQLLKFEESVDIMNKLLENHKWVAGDNMSVADISILVTINTAECIGIDIGKWSNITNWLQRCRKAMEKYGYDEIEKSGCDTIAQFYKNRLQ